MKLRRTQPGSIGLSHVASRRCLVRLSREAGRWTVVAEHVSETDVGSGDQRWNELFERLDRRAEADTLGVAIDGAHGLYRRIDLPPAANDEARRIIATQVETMVPGQVEQVRWSWVRATANGPAVVFVSTLEQVERAAGVLPEGVVADAAIAQPFALDALIASAGRPGRLSRLAVVCVYPHHTQLMAYAQDHAGDDSEVGASGGGGGLVWVEAVDVDAPRGEIDVAQWMDALADVFDRAAQAVPAEQRPESLVCLGFEKDISPVQASLCERLGLGSTTWSDVCSVKGLAGNDLGTLTAAGAAIAAAEPGDGRNLLSDSLGQHTIRRSPLRAAWIAVGVWLLVALVGLYVVTLRAAERYEAAIADSGIDVARIAALDRDVAMARYLETQGPTFLAILDEIGQVTQGLMIDDIRYDREGQVTITGILGSADAINKFASSLATMKTLEAVQVRNQSNVDRDKVKYTLTARPSKRFFGGFVVPTPANKLSDESRSPNERARRNGTQ